MIRNIIYKYLILLYFSSSVFFTFAQTGRIEGRVFNAKNNEPLPFTNIIIWGTKIGSTSDLDGKFVFTGLQPGFIKLAASSVGFAPYTSEDILITNSKTVFIDIAMQETAVQLDAVEIKASPFRKVEESPLSMRSLSLKEIERNPGGNRDISKVIQSLPGVSSSVSFRNDVIVRGGGSSENRFYLDGVEIPNLNHFATQGASGGPVGIINIDFIREVDFYSGAFPANRGNALSSVLEFKQIDGNKDKMSFRGTVGASDLALTLNGPLGPKTTMIASARRSYLQFLFNAIGLPFLPTYNDFQFKVKTKFDLKNELTIIGLGAIDQFSLNTELKDPDESQRFILNYLPVNEQWNYTMGAVYRHFRPNGFYTIVLSRNMLRNMSYKHPGNNESLPRIFDYTSDESENKLRLEDNIRWNGYKLIYGAGTELVRYTNSTYQKIFTQNQLVDINYNSKITLVKYSVFSQLSKGFLKDRLNLSLGIRSDANNFNSEMNNLLNQLSPRFSASYSLTPSLLANFSTGRFYQLPPYTSLGYRNSLGDLVNKQNNVSYISADHIITGLEFLPDDRSKITFEVFHKYYRNYPFSVRDSISLASKGADFGTYGDEEIVSTSEGRAYGAEILIQDKSFYGFNVILAYTLVRSEFKSIDDTYIPSAWDNKHIFTATVTRSFKKNWDLGFKWRFLGGSPYTPYDIDKSSLISAWNTQGRGFLDYSLYNQRRLKNFQQLDVRLDKQFYFKNWSLMLYLDIQNFYNFQAEQPANLQQVLDANGNPVINPNDPNRYVLKSVKNSSGTVLPTIGIMFEF